MGEKKVRLGDPMSPSLFKWPSAAPAKPASWWEGVNIEREQVCCSLVILEEVIRCYGDEGCTEADFF